MKQASTRWKFHFFAQNPKNWQNHDLYSFLFGTEVMMCQKNREGWLVGVWDGDRWDPSHPFWISSHSHTTRRCIVILPRKWLCWKSSAFNVLLLSYPSRSYPLLRYDWLVSINTQIYCLQFPIMEIFTKLCWNWTPQALFSVLRWSWRCGVICSSSPLLLL